MKTYILIVDSGVGGLSILCPLIQKLPNANFIYFCDNKFAPLGNKSQRFLEKHCVKIVKDFLTKFPLGMVVLACNTLTVACVKKLRKVFDFNIVGTEPNIKVGNGKTLVLATRYTAKNCELISNKGFTIVGLDNLATEIDKNFDNLDLVVDYLKSKLGSAGKFDNVVLGCTHYVFVKNQLKKVLGGDIKFFENSEGVVKRVVSLFDNKWINKNPEVKIIFGKSNSKLQFCVENYINNFGKF